MELYKKLLQRIENGETIYSNEAFAKDLANISNEHYENQVKNNGVLDNVIVPKGTLCKHGKEWEVENDREGTIVCTLCGEDYFA